MAAPSVAVMGHYEKHMCERADYIGKLASYAILACLLLINDEAVAALAAKLFAILPFAILA